MAETLIRIPDTIDELLRSFRSDITPDTGDGFLDHFEKNNSENYRLTLLHKKDNAVYCFLSGNMQKISPEIKMDSGMSIAISKKLKIQTHYDTIFHQRDIDNGKYFLIEESHPIKEHQEKVIPFSYNTELPSAVVSKSLKERLLDYITAKSDLYTEAMEMIGEKGFIKTVIASHFNPELKKKEVDVKEIRKSLKKDITSLFKEEQSPSVFIQPFIYLPEDRKKQTMFVKIPYLKYLLIVVPILSLAPYSAIDEIEKNFTVPYKKKFEIDGENKEKEAKSILSEFAIGHPKMIKGTRKLVELCKHSANICMYVPLASITALAYNYTPSIISYPIVLGAGISGATMLTNLVKSRGKDSSGVISTIIDRAIFKRLE